VDCIEYNPAKVGQYHNVKRGGRSVTAHRLAYAEANGLDVFTMGGHVMHSCDNRGCINPEHLSLGDNLANMADKCSKGRQHKRLTTEQIEAIRHEFVPMSKGNGRGNNAAICLKYGVTRGYLSKLHNDKARLLT
jgi:hypothetical protein